MQYQWNVQYSFAVHISNEFCWMSNTVLLCTFQMNFVECPIQFCCAHFKWILLNVQYSFAVHISNEFCWILMLGSWVLSSDCIAAVESCIAFCGIQVEWTDTEGIFFLQVSFDFSVFLWIDHFSMLPYYCTLWCVAALTRRHIITTSSSKFWASLADDTWLFTH